jgi:hypothetical protein
VGVRQSVLNHFSERDVGHHLPAARYQTLPQDPDSLVLDTQHNVVRSMVVLTVCAPLFDDGSSKLFVLR